MFNPTENKVTKCYYSRQVAKCYKWLLTTSFDVVFSTPMQITHILNSLSEDGKTVSRMQLYRYLKQLGISQNGARTIPALYPSDTAHRIKTHIGIEPARRKKTATIISAATMKAAKPTTKGTK